MPLAISPLKHRVARRILVAFLFATLIPFVAFSVWTLTHVSSELTTQAQEAAYADAKSLGMDILGRLRFASDQLRLLAHQAARDDRAEVLDLESLEDRHFLNLTRLAPDGSTYDLWGKATPPSEVLPIAKFRNQTVGQLVLRQGRYDATGQPLIYLWLELAEGAFFGGRLDHALLWSTEDLASLTEQVCVLDGRGDPLYCNRPPAPAWLERASRLARSEDVSRFTAAGRNEPLISAAWSIFLAPHYNVREWTLAIGVPESVALAPVALFRQIFPMVALIALILAAGLSIRLIRRHLRPLEGLMSATRHLSAGNFDTRLELQSNDEFEELGVTFNDMAEQIGSQFGHLKALATLSQQLQPTQTYEQVFDAVLQALRDISSATAFGAVGIERHDQRIRLWSYRMTPHGGHAKAQQNDVQSDQLALPNADWLGDAGKARQSHPWLSLLGDFDDGQLLMLPTERNQSPLGTLALLYPPNEPPDIQERMRLTQVEHVLSDALHQVCLTNRLYHQAHHDPLTNLPNRRLLEHWVEQAIAACAAADRALAVVIIDIDRFRFINEVRGHGTGDAVLLQVADLIACLLPSGARISRFAGDELVVLLSAATVDDAGRRVRQLITQVDQALRPPLRVGARELQVTTSKGVAVYPRDGLDYATLLQNADAALYSGKNQGPGKTHVFSQRLQDALLERADMEAALRRVVANGELQLHFQPLIGLADQRVHGAEALVRWERPGHGLVSPGTFIPLAEETGDIEAIGTWALTEACRALAAWRAQGPSIGHVAVNVSGQQLLRPNFPEHVAAILHATGLPAEHLVLEVTETAFIGRKEESFSQLQHLRELGVRVAIDDFGTGYASMEYLRSLPADIFKIDRLFVAELPDSPRDEAIIKALRAIADELGLGLIAEGVETAAQAELLAALGIPEVQGYHYSRPRPEPGFVDYIAQVGLPEDIDDAQLAHG